MQTAAELKNLLQCIDHKGYPAYKDTRGTYEFPGYVLSIDHVQGDPFAAPSKVSIHVRGKRAGFPEHLYQKDCRRIAVQDCLLRQFARQVEKVSFKAKGSGKSGLMAVSRPGQEVLERSACQMDAKNGDIVLRMEIGFPANGRTVNSRELEKIFLFSAGVCERFSILSFTEKRSGGDSRRSRRGSGIYQGAVRSDGTLCVCGGWCDPAAGVRCLRQTDERCGAFSVTGKSLRHADAATPRKADRNGNKEGHHADRRRWLPWKINTVKSA